MNKITFLVTLLGLLLAFQSQATEPRNLEVKIKYEVASSGFNPMNPLTGIDVNGDAKVSLIVRLADTDVQSIEVLFRRGPQGEILLSKSFEYGVTGTLSDGTTYQSKEDVVELGLGTYNNVSTYYAEVKVIDTSDNISFPLIKVK